MCAPGCVHQDVCCECHLKLSMHQDVCTRMCAASVTWSRPCWVRAPGCRRRATWPRRPSRAALRRRASPSPPRWPPRRGSETARWTRSWGGRSAGCSGARASVARPSGNLHRTPPHTSGACTTQDLNWRNTEDLRYLHHAGPQLADHRERQVPEPRRTSTDGTRRTSGTWTTQDLNWRNTEDLRYLNHAGPQLTEHRGPQVPEPRRTSTDGTQDLRYLNHAGPQLTDHRGPQVPEPRRTSTDGTRRTSGTCTMQDLNWRNTEDLRYLNHAGPPLTEHNRTSGTWTTKDLNYLTMDLNYLTREDLNYLATDNRGNGKRGCHLIQCICLVAYKCISSFSCT